MSSRSTSCALAFLVLVTAIVATPVAQMQPDRADSARRFYPDDPLWHDDDMRTIAPPAVHDLSKSYEFVANTFGDTARSKGPALNVNTLGEVPDSSWFTNRLGRYDMAVESCDAWPEPRRWSCRGRVGASPACRLAGITPKFTIRDARGDTYLLKFDPPTNQELPSSVEMISTKLFHAIGYHVPEDFIVSFTPDRLRVSEGTIAHSGRGAGNRASDVGDRLRGIPRQRDGSYRALASRYVPGKVVGQFMYTGRRADDPNDVFPHERRRELRGMRLFAAWLQSRRRAIDQQHRHLRRRGRAPLYSSLHAGLRLEPGQRQHLRPAAAGRIRVSDRAWQDREGRPRPRPLSATVDVDQMAAVPVGRQCRSRCVRARDVEDRVPESRLSTARRRRCLLGRQHHVAFHRHDDPGGRGKRAALRIGTRRRTSPTRS